MHAIYAYMRMLAPGAYIIENQDIDLITFCRILSNVVEFQRAYRIHT